MRKKITAAARSVGNACLVLLAEPCALFVLAGLSIKMFEGLFGFHAAMRATGETVHGFGLLALEFSRPWSSIFYHLGLVFLLSGLLGTDESLSQKLLREDPRQMDHDSPADDPFCLHRLFCACAVPASTYFWRLEFLRHMGPLAGQHGLRLLANGLYL